MKKLEQHIDEHGRGLGLFSFLFLVVVVHLSTSRLVGLNRFREQ